MLVNEDTLRVAGLGIVSDPDFVGVFVRGRLDSLEEAGDLRNRAVFFISQANDLGLLFRR